MSANIGGVRLSGPAGFAPAGETVRAEGAKGEWNGLAVTVADDPASLVADAAEELTFGASETVEKKVAERKKPDRERRIHSLVPPEAAVEQMNRRNEEKLAKLLAGVRADKGNPAAFRQALDDAFSASADPAERHAALLWLEAELADEPSLAALARRERETFEAAGTEAIQAGYNLDGVDPAGVADRGEGKSLYRRTILGHGGMSAMIREILDRQGDGDFAATVDYLSRAVGADLSAATPSTDKRELEAMNNDLYHLRAIGNFIRDFDADLGKIREKAGKAPLPAAGRETLSLLCRMKDERLPMLDGLGPILALEREKDATYDVIALTRSQNLAHRLPAKVFTDEDSRQRLLAAGQKLLDAAVDIEESISGNEEK